MTRQERNVIYYNTLQRLLDIEEKGYGDYFLCNMLLIQIGINPYQFGSSYPKNTKEFLIRKTEAILKNFPEFALFCPYEEFRVNDSWVPNNHIDDRYTLRAMILYNCLNLTR